MTGARILIDATSASIGGGFTYLVNVIPRLCERAPEHQFRLLLRDEKIHEAIAAPANLECVKLPAVGMAQRLGYEMFQVPRVAADFRANLFFSVGELAPARLPCPSIASFRNACIFSWDVKQQIVRERIRLSVLWVWARLTARSCDRILFVSEDSAQWIGDSIGLPREKRAVVHHGIEPGPWANATPYTGHPRPYLLTVGSIYRHKNYVYLIEAWTELARRVEGAPDLIIVGDAYDAPYVREMDAARQAAGDLADRIHVWGPRPHSEVRSLVAGATTFVFPSLLETFGQPLLEAMAAGVPIVASDLPVFREISGDAARYADRHDPSAFARELEAVLDGPTAQAMVARGRERVQGFTLDHTVDKLLAVIDEVLDSAPDPLDV